MHALNMVHIYHCITVILTAETLAAFERKNALTSMVPPLTVHRYTSEKADLMNFFLVPRFDVPELVLDGYDAYTLRKAWQNVSVILHCYFINYLPI
jgi:hypothetical protein